MYKKTSKLTQSDTYSVSGSSPPESGLQQPVVVGRSESNDSSSLKTEWLTTKEAAEFLKIPVGSLRNLTSNGKVPYYKLTGTRLNRYLRSELQGLLLSGFRGGSYGN